MDWSLEISKVSADALIPARGVRSSWETFEKNSFLELSAFLISVRLVNITSILLNDSWSDKKNGG